MPPPVSAYGDHGSHGPTLFDKRGYNLLKHGPGPNGFIRSLGQYMLGSAATFGFFMSIGTAIRTETDSVAMKEFARMRAAPVVLEMQRRRRRRET
ncbi:unnamed protein product [Tuber aestivum]|uniref:Uncharacterized protein n=1 Tax=Tuber aestivum TaxID=59557 RepID=A0A292PQ43_9PEZI|nr:unnamed protein product [Tuber aestivum]